MNEDWESLKEYLKRDLEKLNKEWSECHKDIYAGTRTIFSLRGGMITHMALVAGALASFSFLIISSPLVHGKTFLILAIIILLGIIAWSFYLLDRILDYEDSSFSKLREQYNELYPKQIMAIEKALMDRNIQEYTKTVKEVSDRLASLRQEEKSEKKGIGRLQQEKSKKWLIAFFLIALLLIGLSFIRL